jgi:hypothetical protein
VTILPAFDGPAFGGPALGGPVIGRPVLGRPALGRPAELPAVAGPGQLAPTGMAAGAAVLVARAPAWSARRARRQPTPGQRLVRRWLPGDPGARAAGSVTADRELVTTRSRPRRLRPNNQSRMRTP